MGSKQSRGVRSLALTVASVALATDALVYGIAVPVLPKIATAEGAQPFSVGVMFAAYAGALVLTTPLAGLWIDRRGNREPLLLGMFGLAAATLLFAFVREPGPLILARALQGVAAGVGWTAGLALIAATHGPAERGKAMGVALSSFGVGTLLGPPLGGLLTEWFDPRAPFFVAFALAVVDGVVRWTMIPRDVGAGAAEVRADLRGRGGLVQVGALTVIGAALIAFLEPILPLHLFSAEAAGPVAVGLVFGAGALVAALVPPLAGTGLRLVSGNVMACAGCAIAALALALLGGLSGVPLIALGLVGVTLGASLVLTPTLTLMADIAEAYQPPAYGAVYALYTLAYTAGLAVAPLVAGAAMDGLGFSGATRLAAGVTLAAGLAVLALGRSRQRTAAIN